MIPLASPSARRFADIVTAGFAGLALGVLGDTCAHKATPEPPVVVEVPVAAPPDAGRLVWLDDMERHMREAELKLTEHSQRIHDLEILNRAQCK